MEKDLMVNFKNILQGKNKKGGDRVQLYLTDEQAQEMISALQEVSATGNGVKLDVHTSQRQTADGRVFTSAFCFVKEKQEFGPGNFTPKKAIPSKTPEERAARVADLKAKVLT